MPIHDWTLVPDGIFHDFHGAWTYAIRDALNAGTLPPRYYALAEQTAGRLKPDRLALQQLVPLPPDPPPAVSPPTAGGGGLAVASAPPKTRFRYSSAPSFTRKARSVVVRHVSGDRVVAMIEVVSSGNKGSQAELDRFVGKVVSLLRNGIHVMVLDLHPPGPRDPDGLHPVIWAEASAETCKLPTDKTLTFASYAAGPDELEAFLEPAAVGDKLPELPLFLTPDVYIPLDLEPPYQFAFDRFPRRWRDVVAPPVS